jgi:hypothetical protein
VVTNCDHLGLLFDHQLKYKILPQLFRLGRCMLDPRAMSPAPISHKDAGSGTGAVAKVCPGLIAPGEPAPGPFQTKSW